MSNFSNEEIQQGIQEVRVELSQHPVILYMKGSPAMPRCGFSKTVVDILANYHIDYAYVDILAPENQLTREVLKHPDWEQQWATFPQLFVNGDLVGGCDIVTDLHENGKLSENLDKAIANPESRG